MSRARSLRSALTLALVVLLVLSVAGLTVFVLLPVNTRAPYTAFYAVNDRGEPTNYLANATVNDPVTVTVGVENHEHARTTYTLVVTTANDTVTNRTFTLADRSTWRRNVTLTFDSPGKKRVSFALYRGTGTSGPPYRSLRVLGNVTTRPR